MKEICMNFLSLHNKLALDMADSSMKEDKKNGSAARDKGKQSGGVQTRPWPWSSRLNHNNNNNTIA